MQTFKKSYLMFLTLVLAAFLVACSDDSNDTSTGDDTSSNSEDSSNSNDDSTASAGGELILEVLSEAVELDPHGSNDVPSANLQANIYDTLLNRNFETGEYLPGLATEWNLVDELTLELKLRDDVKFHDGTPFNAEAVKINLDRLLDPEVASPRASIFQPISEVVVVDEFTVQIKTEAPYVPIYATLTHPGGYMISPAVIAEDYEAMKNGGEPRAVVNEKPVGTGFMKFDSWQAGQQIKLVKNEEYWGGAVAYDSVVFKTIPESATRAADLEAGYAHIIDPVQPIEVERVKQFASVTEQPSVSIAYIGFNTQKAPLDNVKLRQAISKAVDRETIIEGIFEGYALAAVGPLAPATWGYSDDIVKQDYNMEEAKALMKEAGYEDGLKLNLWTNDNPQRIQIATVMQEKLKELNIELNVEVLEWGAYLEKTAGEEHELFILGWSSSTADADNGLNPLFNTADIGNNNRTRYSNPELDVILTKAQQESDETVRADLYKQAATIINEEAPAAFVYHQSYLTGVSNKVSGFSIDASGIYRLKDVKISE